MREADRLVHEPREEVALESGPTSAPLAFGSLRGTGLGDNLGRRGPCVRGELFPRRIERGGAMSHARRLGLRDQLRVLGEGVDAVEYTTGRRDAGRRGVNA